MLLRDAIAASTASSSFRGEDRSLEGEPAQHPTVEAPRLSLVFTEPKSALFLGVGDTGSGPSVLCLQVAPGGCPDPQLVVQIERSVL